MMGEKMQMSLNLGGFPVNNEALIESSKACVRLFSIFYPQKMHLIRIIYLFFIKLPG